ncbi:YihY/virulence factor BrkB family protein [Paenibacillus sp. P26]|nr:YihY/virulence factor BrkB family protein [Paenibacillus sp. P26]UUZ96169.1 YihY/virulence factor BrkB family protein [Paenibacillus sp. P25]
MYCRFQDDEVPAMGAQLTYYLILAFFPFLIFVIACFSFTQYTAEDAIRFFARILPDISSRAIMDSFREIERSRGGSLLSIGLLATLWSASSGVDAIMKALNKAYDQEEDRPYWKAKGISVIFTIGLAVMILISIALLIFGKLIGGALYKFMRLPGNFDVIWGAVQYIFPLAVMVLVFALLYLFTPNTRLKFKEVLPGALFATVGWVITSLLFSLYVNHFGNYTKTYGSIGGIIVLLIWLYLSSIILVLGGEINATLHFDRTGKEKPSCKKFALTPPWGGRPSPSGKADHRSASG